MAKNWWESAPTVNWWESAPVVPRGEVDLGPLRPAPAPAPAQEALPGTRQRPAWMSAAGEPRYGNTEGVSKALLEPTAVMLGGVAGAAFGAPAGPLGSVLGAGAGSALARQFFEPAGPVEATKRIVEGAAMEAGGRVVAPLVERGLGVVARAAGRVADLPKLAQVKAGRVARESFGTELDEVGRVLREAPPNLTAAEALNRAGIVSPTTFALLERSLGRDPRFVMVRELADQEVAQNALARIAGGGSQTAARATQEQAVRNLSQLTEPQKRAALARANLGATQLDMSATAAAARQQAEEAVEGVRRFTRAGTEAAPRIQGELSTARFPGQPRVPFRATYMGELAERADDVTTALAQRSLDAGAVARSNEQAIRTLQAYGIRPLTPASISSQIQARIADPALAGNKPLESALQEVETQLARWTGANGVIDARALDAIRKNAVNSIALQYSAGDPTLQKKVAADLTAALKPAITEAIEKAGGKGYAQYLADYSKARQVIDQKKLGAEAMKLYNGSKEQFVRLVEGNAPETVEQIFGPGSYNIAKELSDNAMATVKGLADKIKAGEAIGRQATVGQDALRELLAENASRFRLPPWINAKVAITNKAIAELEHKLGRKVANTLTEGAKSGQNLDRVLSTLPATERSRVLKILSNPQEWGLSPGIERATIATGQNMLAPETDNRNALAR